MIVTCKNNKNQNNMYQKLGHDEGISGGGGRWLSAVTLLVLVGNNKTKKHTLECTKGIQTTWAKD